MLFSRAVFLIPLILILRLYSKTCSDWHTFSLALSPCSDPSILFDCWSVFDFLFSSFFLHLEHAWRRYLPGQYHFTLSGRHLVNLVPPAFQANFHHENFKPICSIICEVNCPNAYSNFYSNGFLALPLLGILRLAAHIDNSHA